MRLVVINQECPVNVECLKYQNMIARINNRNRFVRTH